MKKMILERCVQLIILLFFVSVFCFGITYMAPGDSADLYIRSGMSEQQKQEIRKSLGVDKGPVEQYGRWLKKTLTGDFGVSLANFQPVMPQILEKLPATILLMGSALFLAILLSIPLGLVSGYKNGSLADKIISAVTCLGISVPPFWFGIILIVLISIKLGMLPTNGMRTVGVNSVSDVLVHLVLPVITLCFSMLASFTQYIRSSTIQELGEDYVQTARSRGCSEKKVLFGHVLKNSLLPVITLAGMSLASLVSGSVVLESLFGWPGIGTLALSAIKSRDYPMIMAFTMITCAVLVIGNFIADILYLVVDPRIKQGVMKNYG